jgi:hypothetical protein
MKNRFLGCVFLLGAIIGGLTQCRIEKRLYSKGYHISSRGNTTAHHFLKNKQNENVQKQTDPVTTIKIVSKQKELATRNAAYAETILASGTNLTVRKLPAIKALPLPPDSCNDVITMMSGDEVQTRIEEIGPTYVKYRRCDYLTGPLITTNTDNIFRIKHANGMTRVFEHAPVATQQPVPAKPAVVAKKNGWAIASFVTGLFSWLLLPAPIALIMGIVGLNQIQKDPQKHKGKWMAVIGIVLGGIVTGLLLLLIAFNVG